VRLSGERRSVFGAVCLELPLNVICGEVTVESGGTCESELMEIKPELNISKE
jgi:hypothetical protein